MQEESWDKGNVVLHQAHNVAGQVPDYLMIDTPKAFEDVSGDYQYLRDQRARSVSLVEAIIRPIRQGLDKLYAIRRDIESVYDKPMQNCSRVMAQYRAWEKEQLEARARGIVETAIEKDEPVENLPEPTKPSGISFREQWSALVVDQGKLVGAVSKGHPGTSLDLLKPNMTALNQLARTLKSELDRMDIGVVSEKREVIITR